MVSEHNNQPVGAKNLPSGLALGQGGGGGRGGRGGELGLLLVPYWASASADVNATSTRAGAAINKQSTCLGRNEEEKEKFASSSAPFRLHPLQQERRSVAGDMQRAVYGEQNAAIDDAATEEGPGRRARWSGPGAKELAVKVDGAATWPTDARRRRTTLSIISQQSTRWGRADMLLKIHLSGLAFGQG